MTKSKVLLELQLIPAWRKAREVQPSSSGAAQHGGEDRLRNTAGTDLAVLHEDAAAASWDPSSVCQELQGKEQGRAQAVLALVFGSSQSFQV